LWAILAILGPGVITGAAGDDAGGVATYSSIGAQYGYSLLWVMGPITLALVIVQLQVARMAVVTGKGFAELIREEFGVRWTAFAMLVLLIANGTVTIAEFAGIAAAGLERGRSRPRHSVVCRGLGLPDDVRRTRRYHNHAVHAVLLAVVAV
jgi:Mn2+/Fe2+ NRAMP family transporter